MYWGYERPTVVYLVLREAGDGWLRVPPVFERSTGVFARKPGDNGFVRVFAGALEGRPRGCRV